MNKKHGFCLVFALLSGLFLWATACSSSSNGAAPCPAGNEGCGCLDGGTCPSGLACLSAHCVIPTGAGGATPSGTTSSSTSSNTGGGGAGPNPTTTTMGSGGMGGGVPPGTGGASGGAGRGGSAGTGGSAGGTADGGPSSGTLGSACKANGDCATGLVCIRSTDNLIAGGGPANGICTANCAANPALCQPLGGLCVAFDAAGTTAYCLERCTIGTPPVGANKCHNRQDATCEPFGTAAVPSFACTPQCLSDADCGARKCNPVSGLCADSVTTTGAAIGSSCMVDNDCAGAVCIPITASDGGPTPGVCSAFCHLGATQGCNYRTTALDAGAAVGGCILGFDTDYGIGDLGLCLQLCDAPRDCSLKAAGWTCVQDATVNSVFHHGACLFPQPD